MTLFQHSQALAALEHPEIPETVDTNALLVSASDFLDTITSGDENLVPIATTGTTTPGHEVVGGMFEEFADL